MSNSFAFVDTSFENLRERSYNATGNEKTRLARFLPKIQIDKYD